MTTPDEQQLITAVVARRDERAFVALYDRHTPYLWRFALRLSAGDEAEASDVVHDAWVRAVERLAGFGNRSALRTWLAGFVLNIVRERARDHAGMVEFDEATAPPADSGEHAAIARVDVDRALSALAPGYRQMLILHDIEGFTHEEIATMLGIQPGTSKSQLSRARRRARELLGVNEGVQK
jgi:RNA polymerase sigma-70 factor (ECF subfamily)